MEPIPLFSLLSVLLKTSWYSVIAGRSATKRYHLYFSFKLLCYLYLKAELFFGRSGLLRRPWHNAASIRLQSIATRGWLSVASSARPPNRIWHCFTASKSSDNNFWRSSALGESAGAPGTRADIIVKVYNTNTSLYLTFMLCSSIILKIQMHFQCLEINTNLLNKLLSSMQQVKIYNTNAVINVFAAIVWCMT
jgi:hypothetical protein